MYQSQFAVFHCASHTALWTMNDEGAEHRGRLERGIHPFVEFATVSLSRRVLSRRDLSR
jgi:hypothetical protein